MSDSDSDSGEMGGVEATVWPHPENVTLSMNADRLVNIVDTDTDGEVPEDIQKLVDCLDCGASAHQWLSTWVRVYTLVQREVLISSIAGRFRTL